MSELAELRKEVERLKGGKTRTWSRCLYCDASIAGDDAHVAILHDPYCPHGKSLQQLAEANKRLDQCRETLVQIKYASHAHMAVSIAENALAAWEHGTL